MFSKYKTLLVIGVWLGAWSPMVAQIVNRGQVMVLSSRAVVASGDVGNQGEISHSGDWYVSGNWANTGTFAEKTGTVRFVNTTGKQSIQHSGQAFYRLLVSGALKIVEDSLSVTDRLELSNATIVPQPNSIFLMRKTATINGASDKAFVNGRLYWEGTQERFYPVGDASGYAPLWLSEEQSDGTSVAPVVGINLAAPGFVPVLDSSIGRISAMRYWERTVLRGQSDRAYATLSILGDESIPTLDSVIVAGATGLDAIFSNLGQNQVSGNSSGGRVTSYGYANVRWLAVGVLATPDKSGLIYVPNAFAPASLNDEERVFKVYGVNIATENLQLMIYNRWGNVIFNSQSIRQITEVGWDGRNQATQKEEAQGVYTYVLKGKFNTGRVFQKKGTVTLLR
jgi:hypothetical protein